MIQIDMDMPKCCYKCFALDDSGDSSVCMITQESRGYRFKVREQRMDTCPLVENKEIRVIGGQVLEAIGAGGEVVDSKESANCPKCGMVLDKFYNSEYCGLCGQKVKWE